MRVVIRADASTWIGTGHVMRCATLAEGLRSQGADILFICRPMPGGCCDWLEAQGFEVCRLTRVENPASVADAGPPAHASWLGVFVEQEIREVANALSAQADCDWLVVDHYALDAQWERAVRPRGGRVLVIDDLADRDHDCDLLLDQNLVADLDERYSRKVPAACGLMLGPRYALLQPSYAERRAHRASRQGPVRRLMVFFGGADTDNLTSRALVAFRRLGRGDIHVDIVIGASNSHRTEIATLAADMPNVHLHDNLPSLAPLMASADLALGAGGATSWERCCLGLPSLVVTVADNQKPVARELQRRGLIRWLGDAREVSEQILTDALREAMMKGSPEHSSITCRMLVDGAGTARVVAVMMASSGTPLRMRSARQEDEDLLLAWANDPVVRANAFSSGPIEPETHRQWFRERLGDIEHCRIYIAEGASGMPIGQVRFDRRETCWQIGYSLDALFRGRGLGRSLLDAGIKRLVHEVGSGIVSGRVKRDNLMSRRVFERLGFISKECGDVVEFSLATKSAEVPGQ
jgi:UDP-2,4-diacetamido-2,4,6-trideoxy-beta-L-altropyranose hydrolase